MTLRISTCLAVFCTLAVACGGGTGENSGASVTAGSGGGSGAGDGDGDTSGDGDASGAGDGDSVSGDGDSSLVCEPGETNRCDGLHGAGICEGVQTCREDGSGWGACECPSGAGGSGSGGSSPGGAGFGGSAGSGGASCGRASTLIAASDLSARYQAAWPGLSWTEQGLDALNVLPEDASPTELIPAVHLVAEHLAWDLVVEPGASACGEVSLAACRDHTIALVEDVGTGRALTDEERTEFGALFEAIESSASREDAQRFTVVAMLTSPVTLYED